VGWVLAPLGGGAADRLPSQLRVCVRTGRLIHVGLGEAAAATASASPDEGAMVPFRLTRELVAALPLGALDGGGRGCLRNVAECVAATLRTPRARAALAGALAVLACDSTLHRPALPATLNGSATAAASIRGKAAATAAALLVLERADGLDGLEPLSAEGQVARLLAEATEHVRLAQMAHEWAAWL